MLETHQESDNRISLLSRALDRHFLACAAVAAGAAITGTAQSADAAIQYSGVLDLQPDHTTATGVYADIDSLTAGFSTASTPGWHLNIYNANFTSGSKAVRLLTPDNLGTPDLSRDADPIGFVQGNYMYVNKLVAGATIDGSSAFADPPTTGYPFGYMKFNSVTTGYDVSPWNGSNTEGYVGFRFVSGGNTHYGWARVKIENFTDPNRPFGITLRDFAYEDTPNTAITAGAVPEPAGLALAVLALGAVGIRPTRKLTAS